MFHVGLNHFLGLSSLLFGMGLYGIIAGKNEISWLIGVMLLFCSVNISLVTFSRFQISGFEGQILPVFTIIIITIQITIAAALVMRNFKTKKFQKTSSKNQK